MKKIYVTNLTVTFIILVVSLIFELTLVLGELGGAVFFLYSTYGLGVQLLVNMLAAIMYTAKRDSEKSQGFWISSAMVVTILVLLLIIRTSIV